MASTYLDLHFHIVFATKGRRNLIRDEWRPTMHAYLAGALHAMGNVVREIKKTSSGWAKDEMREREFAWQEGYAAFSVSAAVRPAVATYIANQEEHHRVRGSEEELLEMLQLAQIAYDVRYFE